MSQENIVIYEPNFTQIPNSVISVMPHLSETEFKVIMAICRKTFGYHKKKDRISLSQLETMTGMSRKSITKAIKSDKFRGLIKTYKTPRGNEYEPIITPFKENEGSVKSTPPDGEVVKNLPQTSVKSTPPASVKSTHTKENSTKENKQKILVAGSAFDESSRISDVISKADLSIQPTSTQGKMALLAVKIWKDVDDLRPNNRITQSARLGAWYHPIRLMVEQDGRTLQEIWNLWKAVHKDSFWRQNILSTSKLRDKFDQLAIKLEPQNKDFHGLIDKLYG